MQEPLIIPLPGKIPHFGKECWLAPNATVIGEVTMGDNCTIWFNAVVRGDVHSIAIGERVNIQDGAIIHCTYQKANVVIGTDVSIAHNAIVHGCSIGDRVLVGMGAIVMDHALIEPEVIVAAGSVVLQNSVLESGFIYAGAPAKKIKPISDDMKEVFLKTSRNYIMYSKWFIEQNVGKLLI